MATEDTRQDGVSSTSGDGVTDGPQTPAVEELHQESESPYRNLLVPLVLVPAMIAVLFVIIYTLAAGGSPESTMDENLHKVLNGGSNERTQAAFALVEQLAANNRSLLLEEELPWEVSERLAPNLASALGGLDDDEARLQYVLSSALLYLDDPAGLEGLLRVLALDEEADPGAELRFHALLSLGIRGEEASFKDVASFLTSSDVGLRTVAVGCLRFFPKELAQPSLQQAMGDSDLAVRLNAAIGLSWLGDPSGAALLRDGAGVELYEAERARDPRSYARQDIVRGNRVKAIEALIRLGRPEDRVFLEGLSADEEDLAVREAALKSFKTSE